MRSDKGAVRWRRCVRTRRESMRCDNTLPQTNIPLTACPTAWVSVAWANAKTFPEDQNCARRSLAHSGFISKGYVNQAHVHCKPLLGSARSGHCAVGLVTRPLGPWF